MKKTQTPREDIYTRITNQIIAALEKGVKPWTLPWNATHAAGLITRPLRHNGEPYAGINVLSLWASATEHGYNTPIWMTYKQAKQLGGQVRKSEKGAPVVYANTIIRAESDNIGESIPEPDTDDENIRIIPFLKSYTVFNVDQIENLPDKYYTMVTNHPNPDQRIQNAETYCKALGAVIQYTGLRACYIPSTDEIHIPPFEIFNDAESYYATLFHECVHWTSHESRLNRDFGLKKFGDAGYAREELVAEIGAALLCADLGITCEDREDHAAYIQSWLQVLRNDKRAVFSAAAYAQRAVTYLHGLQHDPVDIAKAVK